MAIRYTADEKTRTELEAARNEMNNEEEIESDIADFWDESLADSEGYVYLNDGMYMDRFGRIVER